MAAQSEARSAAEAVARASYGKLVAFLCARTRDVAAAEDALGEAFAQALAHWPQDGVPERPAAWVVQTAKRRLIDQRRSEARHRHAAALPASMRPSRSTEKGRSSGALRWPR